MSENDARGTAGSGYPLHQLAKAFRTAATHEDPETRRRARDRVLQWANVLSGMASGRLTIGSRTPVRDLPAWATPEVVRGGFATGAAAAGGPLLPHKREAARRAGVRAERRAVFGYYLTEPGLAELSSMLEHGRYGGWWPRRLLCFPAWDTQRIVSGRWDHLDWMHAHWADSVVSGEELLTEAEQPGQQTPRE